MASVIVLLLTGRFIDPGGRDESTQRDRPYAKSYYVQSRPRHMPGRSSAVLPPPGRRVTCQSPRDRAEPAGGASQ